MAGKTAAKTADDVIAHLRQELAMVIADRDAKAEALREEKAYAKNNYEAGSEWRKAGEAARKELAEVRRELADRDMLIRTLTGQVRFAEGFIAALKGEAYVDHQHHTGVPF
jgi:hypothetical protein